MIAEKIEGKIATSAVNTHSNHNLKMKSDYFAIDQLDLKVSTMHPSTKLMQKFVFGCADNKGQSKDTASLLTLLEPWT